MKTRFDNGAIIAEGMFYEEAEYNVSNEKISAVFDGKGAVTYCDAANEDKYISQGCSAVHINGEHIDVFSKKTVKMIGRMQSVMIETGNGIIKMECFLDKSSKGIFVSYSLETPDDDVVAEIACIAIKKQPISVLTADDVTSVPENSAIYIKLTPAKNNVKLFLSCEDTEVCDANIVEKFENAFRECIEEIQTVKVPDGLSEAEKAMFYSTYFCALENYKEIGEYKAFMAGYKYLMPARSYYRDSYFTVLPMYNGHTEKVKNQIVVLAKGIADDGTCPSAVKADYSMHWGNHYDSPSFLAMMLYDYVKFTQDTSILDEVVDGVTVLDKAAAAIEKLSECEDGKGLLYKAGRYNRRDWADEVNRYGYVTYDEILYARACYGLAKLKALKGDEKKSAFYHAKYLKVKAAINEELWDDELGYYINFKNEDYVENNLSIDTVLAAIFDIADETRARRMLSNMEKLLETRNNFRAEVKDFGVMCVYPFYSKAESAYRKSAQPYNYHNGANWPYLSAMYAYAKRKYGMEYKYALGSWFEYNVEKGNYTPIEYFSPVCKDGSLLQAWSGAVAFVQDERISRDFFTE